MARTAAKPFDFDEFGAERETPEPKFTNADIEEARREAKAAALASILAEQARVQSDILSQISNQLAAANCEFDNALTDYRTVLAETARAIVTSFCAGAAADRQIEIALGLLDKYLAATPDKAALTILLPHNAPDDSIKALKKEVASRNIAGFVSVETSAAISTGDCRIDWRGGAIRRDLKVINEDIKTIFASVDSERKMRNS